MGRMTNAIVAGIVMLASAFFMAFGATSGGGSVARMTTPDILARLAEAANEMQGEEVGPGVVVDHATVENGRLLTYHYIIPAMPSGGYDRDRVEHAEAVIRSEACADLAIRRAVDGGGVVRYRYQEPSGRTLFTISVTRRACARLG